MPTGPPPGRCVGVDKLHVAAAKTQAVHGAGGGRIGSGAFEPEQVLIEVQARLNVAADNAEVNGILGCFHHG